MVFRRIENWIEGDRNQQQKLDNGPLTADKFFKKTLKHGMFLVISFLIANTFLAYLIGSDTLIKIITAPISAHLSGFISIGIFSLIFYLVFSRMRELVCTVACPYGRLQGALLDDKSIIVAYDHLRGEKVEGRGKLIKNENRLLSGKGDCIDCKLCVAVCPTGIDIRNGTQLECINCTACIDECNTVMDRVGLPKDLIRYASEDEITKKEKFVFTARMKGYTAVLAILTGIFIGMLFLRNDVEATVLRLPGQLFEHKGAVISNVYTYKIINKSAKDFNAVHFKLANLKGEVKLVGKPDFKVVKEGMVQGTLFVEINPELLKGDKTKIILEVYNGSTLIETEATNFLGPRHFN